jgi:hypothetical protein
MASGDTRRGDYKPSLHTTRNLARLTQSLLVNKRKTCALVLEVVLERWRSFRDFGWIATRAFWCSDPLNIEVDVTRACPFPT